MKKLIFIFLLALLSLVLSGCVMGWRGAPQVEPGSSAIAVAEEVQDPPAEMTGPALITKTIETVSAPPEVAEEVTEAEDAGDTLPTAEDGVYYNETFGFQLTLPETWTGYVVSENGNDQLSAVCFTFPEHGPICVLQIDVFTKAAWNNLAKMPPNYYLAENEQYVFAAEPGGAAECVQLDAFQCARYQEIPGILSGFTLSGN